LIEGFTNALDSSYALRKKESKPQVVAKIATTFVDEIATIGGA
jgi:hypothetical protein